MAYPSPAQELRHLLSVAKKLRDVAAQWNTGEADRDLFLAAACALEARAGWMANAAPGERYDPAHALHVHQPVNMLV
jgi:hypothetical protein